MKKKIVTILTAVIIAVTGILPTAAAVMPVQTFAADLANCVVKAANKADGMHFTITPVKGATYYKVTYSAGGNSNTRKITDTKNPVHIFGGAVNGVNYKYTAQAFNAKGKIAESTKAKTLIFLKHPGPVSVAENTSGTLTVTWKQNNKASGYAIYRSIDGGNTYTKDSYASITGYTTTSFIDKSVAAGKQYRYRVYALSTAGGANHSCAATSANVVFNHTSDAGTYELKPTCTTSGIKVYKCKYCKKELKKEYPAKLGHVYGDWIKTTQPTCKEKGVKIRTCTREGCGATETQELDKVDHKKKATNPEAATCTKAGMIHYECEYCQMDMGTEYTEASGHTPVIDPAVPATTTHIGKTEGSHCLKCGEILVAQKIIPIVTADAVKQISVENSGKGIKITWSKAANADGYYVFRKNGKGKYKTIATIAGNGTIVFNDKNVKQGKQYTYKVRAYKKAGSEKALGVFSPEKSMIYVPAIKPMSVKSKVKGTMTITWQKMKNINGYQIVVKPKKGKAITKTKKANETSAIVKGLKKGNYVISVRAFVKKGGKKYYGGKKAVAVYLH